VQTKKVDVASTNLPDLQQLGGRESPARRASRHLGVKLIPLTLVIRKDSRPPAHGIQDRCHHEDPSPQAFVEVSLPGWLRQGRRLKYQISAT